MLPQHDMIQRLRQLCLADACLGWGNEMMVELAQQYELSRLDALTARIEHHLYQHMPD